MAVWIRDNAATLLVRVILVVLVIVPVPGRIPVLLVGRSLRVGLHHECRVFSPTFSAVWSGRSPRSAGLATGLWIIGVNPAALLTGLGVAGVIVGLALQDSMSQPRGRLLHRGDTRPFDVDDLVEAAGVLGKVKAIGFANTTIVTLDYRRLYVPNRKIWSEVIENRSSESIRRVQRKARISYREDVGRALQVLE